MTYKQFCRVAKSYPDNQKGTLLRVNFRNNVCYFKFMDRVTELSITNLVNDVYRDGMGGLTNPSKLKGWSGFDNSGM